VKAEPVQRKLRDPDERDRRQASAIAARQSQVPEAFAVKIYHEPGQAAAIGPNISDSGVWAAKLLSAFGTTNLAFAGRLMTEIVNAVRRDPKAPASEEDTNAALAAVQGIGPRDETEALLAVQMVATHNAAMEFMRRSMLAQQRDNQNDCGQLAIKLLRTYTTQVEALQRYRGKGQQKMLVEHVHVYSGGQAIVGTVTGGAGAQLDTEGQSHAKQLGHAPESAMRGADAKREAVLLAGGER
jgi:hypothetical protein